MLLNNSSRMLRRANITLKIKQSALATRHHSRNVFEKKIIRALVFEDQKYEFRHDFVWLSSAQMQNVPETLQVRRMHEGPHQDRSQERACPMAQPAPHRNARRVGCSDGEERREHKGRPRLRHQAKRSGRVSRRRTRLYAIADALFKQSD